MAAASGSRAQFKREARFGSGFLPLRRGKRLRPIRACDEALRWLSSEPFGDAPTHSRAEALGAILFDKPFDVDDLRTAVLNLVPVSDPMRKRGARFDCDDDEARGHERTFTVIASFSTSAGAFVAKERLHGAGVKAHVAGERTAGSMPYLSLATGAVTLYVLNADAKRAREILGTAVTES